MILLIFFFHRNFYISFLPLQTAPNLQIECCFCFTSFSELFHAFLDICCVPNRVVVAEGIFIKCKLCVVCLISYQNNARTLKRIEEGIQLPSLTSFQHMLRIPNTIYLDEKISIGQLVLSFVEVSKITLGSKMLQFYPMVCENCKASLSTVFLGRLLPLQRIQNFVSANNFHTVSRHFLKNLPVLFRRFPIYWQNSSGDAKCTTCQ